MLFKINNGGLKMNRKKLSLIVVLALIFPTLLTSFSVNNTVSAATNSEWTQTKINLTIHTKNLMGMPLYDQQGQVIKDQSAPANQDYSVVETVRNNQTGETFYGIGNNQFLSAVEVMSGIPNMRVNYYHANIHVVNQPQIQLYDGNGIAIGGMYVKGDTSWYTNQQAVNIDTGVTYYQVSPNRYVSSNDVDSFVGA